MNVKCLGRVSFLRVLFYFFVITILLLSIAFRTTDFQLHSVGLEGDICRKTRTCSVEVLSFHFDVKSVSVVLTNSSVCVCVCEVADA